MQGVEINGYKSGPSVWCVSISVVTTFTDALNSYYVVAACTLVFLFSAPHTHKVSGQGYGKHSVKIIKRL